MLSAENGLNVLQTVPIKKGKTYALSFWVNASELTKGTVVFDTADRYDGPGQGQFVINEPTAGWVKYSGSFTSTNNRVPLRIFTPEGFEGAVYFDRIILAPTEPSGK